MSKAWELLAEAQSHKKAGKLEESIAAYKRLVSMYPFSVEAVAAQAELRRAQLNPERLSFNRETSVESIKNIGEHEVEINLNPTKTSSRSLAKGEFDGGRSESQLPVWGIDDESKGAKAEMANIHSPEFQSGNAATTKNVPLQQSNNEGVAPVSAKDVILTTASAIEGYSVIKTIDIITSECAFGMNVFRDFFAAWTDFFGGRSAATQKVLRDARIACLTQLREEAVSRGANAVIAVDLDYSEFSGKGKSMLFLVASGTAVKVTKL